MQKKALHLSKELSLPLEVAGEAIGILATRGAGKSYTSADLVEELWMANIQVAVVDPTGVYWGLQQFRNALKRSIGANAHYADGCWKDFQDAPLHYICSRSNRAQQLELVRVCMNNGKK